MRLDQRLAYRQAQAQAAEANLNVRLPLLEGLKDLRQSRGIDSNAGIGNLNGRDGVARRIAASKSKFARLEA